MTNTLIIGTGKRSQRFIELLKDNQRERRIIGLVDEDVSKIGEDVQGHKVIGSFKDLPDILHDNAVDEVVFVVPRSWLGRIEDIIYSCETEGRKISVAVDFFEPRIARTMHHDFGGFPLVTFESAPNQRFSLILKRAMDILFSSTALFILMPLFAVIAAAVKLSSPGPLFFKQERCGVNGRRFTFYKFRTMVVDAEARLAGLRGLNEMKGPAFKMHNDPRITPVGRFLRKFSLDELPQFWNVLCGEMSLVGPRPPIPSEVNQYDGWHRRRLSTKPGLTCLWQVNGRNKITDFDEWMKLDLQYIDRWSLWLDLKILFKTVPVVLFGIGAK